MTRSTSALLRVTDLTVQLRLGDGVREVISGSTFEIDAGEAMGLVGESGSGKSMTARAIARLLPTGAQVSGQVSFDGMKDGGQPDTPVPPASQVTASQGPAAAPADKTTIDVEARNKS